MGNGRWLLFSRVCGLFQTWDDGMNNRWQRVFRDRGNGESGAGGVVGLRSFLGLVFTVALFSTLTCSVAGVLLFPGASIWPEDDSGVEIEEGIGWRCRVADRSAEGMYSRVDTFGWPSPCFSSEWEWRPAFPFFRSDSYLADGIRLKNWTGNSFLRSVPLGIEWGALGVNLIFWSLLWSGITYGTFRLWELNRAIRRGKLRCRHCGYSREGAPTAVCSECGEVATGRPSVMGWVLMFFRFGIGLHFACLLIGGTWLWSQAEPVATLALAIREHQFADAKTAFLELPDPDYDLGEYVFQKQFGIVTTPLVLAAWNDNVEFMRLAISSGATVDLRDRSGLTALYWAARAGRADAMRVLLDAGASVDLPFALLMASGAGSLEGVRMLLEAGVDPTQGRAMHRAAGHASGGEIIELLLEYGADLNRLDIEGRTPLIMAARAGEKSNIAILLEAGADGSIKDNDGYTYEDYLK